MIALTEVFPDEAIFATLSQELGWSHFVELLPLDKPMQRDFYAEMCRIERWSVRTLRRGSCRRGAESHNNLDFGAMKRNQ